MLHAVHRTVELCQSRNSSLKNAAVMHKKIKNPKTTVIIRQIQSIDCKTKKNKDYPLDKLNQDKGHREGRKRVPMPNEQDT